MVITLTPANFQAEVLEAKGLVLVDFWAPWCGLCQLMGPIVDEVAAEMTGQVKVGKVNIDEGMDLAQQYSVLGIPTLMIFKDGQSIGRLDQAQTKEAIVARLLSYQTD